MNFNAQWPLKKIAASDKVLGKSQGVLTSKVQLSNAVSNFQLNFTSLPNEVNLCAFESFLLTSFPIFVHCNDIYRLCLILTDHSIALQNATVTRYFNHVCVSV